MRNKDRHGEHQEIHIGEFTSDRTGLLSGSAQRHRSEEHDDPDWQWLRLGNAPPAVVPCVGSRRSFDAERSLAIYTYTYEGINGEPPDDAIDFEMDFSMSEEPIQTHPNFAKLKETFGWLANKQMFPETATPLPGKTALLADKTTATKVSKMYGKESWLSVGAMFKRTYCRTSIPASIMRGIGTIIKGVPPGVGQFQLPATYSKRRNWLKMAPNIKRRGNCVRISEEAWLSGPGGWVEEMYSFAALFELAAESGRI